MRTQRWKTLRTRLGLGVVLNLISWDGSASFLNQSQSVVKQNQRNPGLPLIPALFSQPMKLKSTLLPVFSYTFSFALIGSCDCYDFSEKVEKRTNFACLNFFLRGEAVRMHRVREAFCTLYWPQSAHARAQRGQTVQMWRMREDVHSV